MAATDSLMNWAASRLARERDGAAHAHQVRATAPADMPDVDEKLASFLGWFSIGLGLSQLVATRDFARFIGIEDRPANRKLLRLIGLRELTAGVGILARRRPSGWLWARVAGDAMDLALLGKALASAPPHRGRLAAVTVAVVGVTALDVLESIRHS